MATTQISVRKFDEPNQAVVEFEGDVRATPYLAVRQIPTRILVEELYRREVCLKSE